MNDYLERYVEVDGKLMRVPPERQIRHWVYDSVCEATDGCTVEPDGSCPHGKQSWLLILGLI